MRPKLLTTLTLLLPFSTTIALPSSPLPAPAASPNEISLEAPSLSTQLPNANHIFNSIHSAMRQWGSSVRHNGMSYFIATVPEGVQLYHGRRTADPVEGLEWLAFEVEHAMLFARSTGPVKDELGIAPSNSDSDSQQILQVSESAHLLEEEEEEEEEKDGEAKDYGYLHTYKTAHPLRLLYLDGMSAAKCPIGTMDAQDVVLLNYTTTPNPGSGLWERERAKRLCELVSTEWGDTIHGFIRMEAGFEIILCDFQRHLLTERITAGDPRLKGVLDNDASWEYYRIVAARYPGLGGERVKVEFGDFVSGWDWEKYGVDFSNSHGGEGSEEGEGKGRKRNPRLDHLDAGILSKMKDDIGTLARSSVGVIPDGAGSDSAANSKDVDINWQAVADLYVTRYSDALLRLINIGDNPSFVHSNTSQALAHGIELLVRPFVDWQSSRNMTAEIERCAGHFIPGFRSGSGSETSLAGRAVFSTASTICSTLLTALDLVTPASSSPSSSPSQDQQNQQNLQTARTLLNSLIDYLDWPIWRYCTSTSTSGSKIRGCAPDEFCFIAMWPFGSAEDHYEPKCVKREGFIPREGDYYWGPDGFFDQSMSLVT